MRVGMYIAKMFSLLWILANKIIYIVWDWYVCKINLISLANQSFSAQHVDMLQRCFFAHWAMLRKDLLVGAGLIQFDAGNVASIRFNDIEQTALIAL